jgi:pyruvate formate lyase activating enzyme
VAFTYNDPVIFAEYAIDTAKACREHGIKNVAVTAGYITEEARGEFYSVMDAANVDLKAFSETFYHKLCFAHLEPVLSTLRYLRHETDVWLEVTTLLIPGENDARDEIDRLCEWYARELGEDVPLHFTAFHPDFMLREVRATPAATLARAREQALSHGLKHVYTGNVHDRSGQSTYCAVCGELLIERVGYTLGQWNLTDAGCCRACHCPLAGRFENGPGEWGARRQPISIA